ncbi:hypothetical protein [Epilithonimonas hungarica]|uniref:Uncharacterized protein n=1 Tax=Epilithonimonas hungarica TaxID=454006 RepID=A0A1G7JD20_9FLAO|nr:hypothetical protein [Epilithonimonas hungarica]SDF22857.1 hypothetical protein SAMN05421825_1352 [Epilithonimonas hungarica]
MKKLFLVLSVSASGLLSSQEPYCSHSLTFSDVASNRYEYKILFISEFTLEKKAIEQLTKILQQNWNKKSVQQYNFAITTIQKSNNGNEVLLAKNGSICWPHSDEKIELLIARKSKENSGIEIMSLIFPQRVGITNIFSQNFKPGNQETEIFYQQDLPEKDDWKLEGHHTTVLVK